MDTVPMKYLSLFSGICGGDLWAQNFLKWKCLGYVEWEKYCCDVIKQRIKDGLLSDAPIFQGDIRRFNSEGYAKAYQGMVDVITAGFPCQPFSVAGKQRGEQDERNMWPTTWDTIRIIRPRFTFLENVPGLLNSGYFRVILNNLHEIGYDVRWACLSAKEVGAQHQRERLWIVATDPMQSGLQKDEKNIEGAQWNEIIYRPWTSCDISRDLPIKWKNCERYCPDIRKGNGIPKFMDRIAALGNAQVPQVAATAWNILIKNETAQRKLF